MIQRTICSVLLVQLGSRNRGCNSHRIGQSGRAPLRVDKEIPGPAAYILPTTVGKGPKVLLHGKRAQDKIDNIPGPGAYEPNHKATLEAYPKIALSTGPRVEKDRSSRKDVPGPGQYELRNAFNGPKFG